MKRFLCNAALVLIVFAVAAPAAAQIGFGRAVAVGDDEVFVGEPGNQATPGYVYVYRTDGGVWTEARKLSADDAMDADGFGSGMAVEGLRIAIGAENANAVYIFEHVDGEWTQVAKIESTDSAAADLFGAAVGLHGNRLIVGAPEADGSQGAAYLFELTGRSWRQVARFAGAGETVPERLGASVAIDDDMAVAGAPEGKIDFFLAGYATSAAPGAAYVYQRADGGWQDTISYGLGLFYYLKKVAFPGVGIVAGRNEDFSGNFVTFQIGFGY